MKEHLIDRAWNKIYYARNSYSIRLVYKAHGFLDGLVESGALPYDDTKAMYDYLLRECINNGDWLTEMDRREKDDLDTITYK